MSYELFANAATSSLVSRINSSVTSLTVVDASSFPATGNFRIVIDTEIMQVTAVSTNTLTVVRGTEGTTAASHSSAATVTVILTAAALASFRSDTIQYGTNSSRPSASKPGVLYFPSDGEGTIARDSGSVWNPFGLYSFPLTAPSTGTFGTTLGTGTDSFTQNGDCIVHKANGVAATTVTAAHVGTLTQDKIYTVQLSPFFTPYSSATSIPVAMPGLIIRDSATGNTRCFGFHINLTTTANSGTFTSGNRSFGVVAFTYTSGNFVLGNNINSFANSNYPTTPIFLRVNQPSSGNRLWQWSIDNQNWITHLSEAWNLGVANPDQVGFLVYAGSNFGTGASGNGVVGSIIRHYTQA